MDGAVEIDGAVDGVGEGDATGVNAGVELGQLAVVAVAVALLAAVRRYDVRLAERCVVVGSVGVIAAGVYWFAQRVGFVA